MWILVTYRRHCSATWGVTNSGNSKLPFQRLRREPTRKKCCSHWIWPHFPVFVRYCHETRPLRPFSRLSCLLVGIHGFPKDVLAVQDHNKTVAVYLGRKKYGNYITLFLGRYSMFLGRVSNDLCWLLLFLFLLSFCHSSIHTKGEGWKTCRTTYTTLVKATSQQCGAMTATANPKSTCYTKSYKHAVLLGMNGSMRSIKRLAKSC